MEAGDWREAIDETDAALLDRFQSDVPIRERPLAAVGDQLGIDAATVLERVTRLIDIGLLRRFGPVLNPPVIGSSTLAALQAPPDRFEEIAAAVNDHHQVNHNYARDHEWNMWFVVTATDRATRDRILDDIETETGCELLVLPMKTDYYIDLEFPVVNGDRFARESADEAGSADLAGTGTVTPTRISGEPVADLSPLHRRVLLAVQEGFPLSETPYRDIAATVDAPTEEVITAVADLHENGCIKRIGCVVNHVATGFDANCMVVWDVPDAERDDRGTTVGSLPYVTLCYHRPRRPAQDWPYSLFTMIHGRDEAAVDAKIDELATEYLPVDHERLYSTETLKQTGARYSDLLAE
jgi:DNA-binding Lrp family transcriptional regulator